MTMVTITLSVASCSQFEPRDKRFYYRALWNFSLREDLAELDSEFNGVDFGHSKLYETLLLTDGIDVPAVEDRARKETLAFIATKPRLNPNEEAIAPMAGGQVPRQDLHHVARAAAVSCRESSGHHAVCGHRSTVFGCPASSV